jgi:hypothetical protein
MKKDKEAILKYIERAIESVVGPKKITPESLLRRDLNVQSLELIEVFFELKRLTGQDALAGILFAATRDMSFTADISVSELLEIIAAK